MTAETTRDNPARFLSNNQILSLCWLLEQRQYAPIRSRLLADTAAGLGCRPLNKARTLKLGFLQPFDNDIGVTLLVVT